MQSKNRTISKPVGVALMGDPHSRGITLIALIITIIVMIILVGVTVNVAINGELFNTSQKAAYQTEVRTVQEQLETEKVVKIAENDGNIPYDFGLTISNLDISEDLKSKYGAKLIISRDGTLYYDPEVVTDKEEQSWLEEIGVYEYAADLALLEKYFLGEDGEGRTLTEIMDNNYLMFIDNEEEVIPNASTALPIINIGRSEDYTKYYYYVQYENIVYKIICDNNTDIIEEVSPIYEPSGREGDTYAYDIDGDGTKEECIILYDYGEGQGIEIIAPTTVGETLTLGYNDSTIDWTNIAVIEEADLDGDNLLTNVEKAIYSYNHAIETINDYCKEQVTNTSIAKENIRSVGSNPDNPYSENTTMYTSDNLESNLNSAYNGVGKSGDMNYEQDLVRMSYHECDSIGASYWLASRTVNDYVSGGGYTSGHTVFYMRYSSDTSYYAIQLWEVSQNGVNLLQGSYFSRGVRPVIKVPNV